MKSILKAGRLINMARSICEHGGLPKTFLAHQLAFVLNTRKNIPVIVTIDGKKYNISGVGSDSDDKSISLEVEQN